MKRLARQLAGETMHISPLTVAGLLKDAAEDHDDPGSPEARSASAAKILRRGDAIRWPPGRNHPCWCGWGRKYKQCCGPIPSAEDDRSAP